MVTKRNPKALGRNDLFLFNFVYFHCRHTKENAHAQLAHKTHTYIDLYINAHKCIHACTFFNSNVFLSRAIFMRTVLSLSPPLPVQ